MPPAPPLPPKKEKLIASHIIDKIKHVKKVGHTSEFLFDIYWWTWKTVIY